MIESWLVGDALRSRFGSVLADAPGIWDKAAALLQNYAPYKDTFDSLAVRLEDALFNAVYEQLGPSMGAQMDDGSLPAATVYNANADGGLYLNRGVRDIRQMDDGTVRRIRTSELKDAADDVMGVLFEQLKVYSVTYDALHSYCMSTGSFSAMRVLYTKYAGFMPASERKILARIIRDSRPKAQWETWLDPEDRQ